MLKIQSYRVNTLCMVVTACLLAACSKVDPEKIKTDIAQQGTLSNSPHLKSDKRMPINAFHPKLLSADQEKTVIELVKSSRTKDGATVSDVLQYAETQIPDKFKVAKYDIFYTQAGDPTLVGICYWLGDRRLEDEIICDMAYKMSSDYKTVAPDTIDTVQEPVTALHTGKDSFVTFLKKAYSDQCLDSATGKKGC